MKNYVFKSPDETKEFASELAQKVPDGKIIALIGNLGTGKTTFSQGFALGMDIHESIISPTFKLVSEYCGDRALNHIDCYRLDSSTDFLNIGGENFLNCENGVTLIEWADRIKELWIDDWMFIYFDRDQQFPETRLVKIVG
jgi:tRNA threonylcarbamoyladenosine biosynthesis protein TsaE|tara:strand:- start:210 stop:632 length:423 start_codon:yes stop_codon:yes gene_type:complete